MQTTSSQWLLYELQVNAGAAVSGGTAVLLKWGTQVASGGIPAGTGYVGPAGIRLGCVGTGSGTLFSVTVRR